ncbi:ATP-binding protein [Pedobacter sp. SYSU D00535]|uniref:ATP-binding protein n=1 Tax=Pedobacter sp. SYSU D00535 TaxID=2810308 RepID=UPI001A978046|nr:ATP-binding protein [Pedobacter sp. SYSU D00535]
MQNIVFLKYYKQILDRIAARETDPLNQARVKVLCYGLTANLALTSIATLLYFIQGPPLQFFRGLIAFAIAVVSVYLVYHFPVWRKVSHFICIVLSLVVWSNLLVYVKGTNIPTLQFAFLVVVFSFYVLGQKWGLIYSLLNILPIVAYTVLDGKHYFFSNIPAQPISQPAYVFVVTYNFLLIVFLHYHFFKTFNQNILHVTKAKNDLSSMNKVLQQAMKELEKTSKAKMDFLSTMSHELRTPLNGVIGLSNIMLMENPREDQKENLSVLKFSAENLLSLINDILDLNKLESGKTELEKIPVDLTDLLQKITASLQLKATEKGLVFELVVDKFLENKIVNSDPTRITQVLINLINNAIKFTETGSVKACLEVVDHSKELLTVRFSVTDTGIGIPPEKQADIFEPFTQASKSTTRQFGGTGLGLAIVKKILLMFNTSIHLESIPGMGTKFWFDIQFAYSEREAKRRSEAPAIQNELQGLKVLVAEDNLVNVMVIKKILSHWDINPKIAENGAVAIHLLKAEDFDVVLMDLHMPEMDGYEASKRIRQLQDPAKSSVPIIALTASVSNAVDRKVLDAGMDGYLSKPFNPDDLYDKLIRLTASEQ